MRDFNLNGFDTITFKAVPDSGSEQAQELLMYDEYQTRDNFYELLLDQVQELYHKGMTVPEIKEYIRKQYQQQMDKGLPKAKNKIQLDKEILAKIVTPEIVSIIEDELEASHGRSGGAVYSAAAGSESGFRRHAFQFPAWWC